MGTFVKEMRAGGPAASGDVSKLDEQETAPAENASAQPAPEALQASTSKVRCFVRGCIRFGGGL